MRGLGAFRAFAHVGEQFIFRMLPHHRGVGESAVESEGVVETEAEGRNDRLGEPIERLCGLDLDIPIDQGLAFERGPMITVSFCAMSKPRMIAHERAGKHQSA
jgi:hypothetical protein